MTEDELREIDERMVARVMAAPLDKLIPATIDEDWIVILLGEADGDFNRPWPDPEATSMCAATLRMVAGRIAAHGGNADHLIPRSIYRRSRRLYQRALERELLFRAGVKRYRPLVDKLAEELDQLLANAGILAFRESGQGPDWSRAEPRVGSGAASPTANRRDLKSITGPVSGPLN